MKTNVTYLIVAHQIQGSLSHGYNLSICSDHMLSANKNVNISLIGHQKIHLPSQLFSHVTRGSRGSSVILVVE